MAILSSYLCIHLLSNSKYLSNHGTCQALNLTNATTFRDKLAKSSLWWLSLLAELLDNTSVETNFQVRSGCKSWLNHLPDLLLWVQKALWLTLPSFKEYSLANLC